MFMNEENKLNLGSVNNRFEVKWSHHLCHPETCCCAGDYRVYDNIEKYYIEYSDDELYLKNKYGC